MIRPNSIDQIKFLANNKSLSNNPIVPNMTSYAPNPESLPISVYQLREQTQQLVLISNTFAGTHGPNPLRRGNTGNANSEGLSRCYEKLLVNMKMAKSSRVCSVCCEGFSQGQIIKQMPCKHIFHRQCIKPWLRTSHRCPNCRFDIEEHFRSRQVKEDIGKQSEGLHMRAQGLACSKQMME